MEINWFGCRHKKVKSESQLNLIHFKQIAYNFFFDGRVLLKIMEQSFDLPTVFTAKTL